jgi:hypothetical protein
MKYSQRHSRVVHRSSWRTHSSTARVPASTFARRPIPRTWRTGTQKLSPSMRLDCRRPARAAAERGRQRDSKRNAIRIRGEFHVMLYPRVWTDPALVIAFSKPDGPDGSNARSNHPGRGEVRHTGAHRTASFGRHLPTLRLQIVGHHAIANPRAARRHRQGPKAACKRGRSDAQSLAGAEHRSTIDRVMADALAVVSHATFTVHDRRFRLRDPGGLDPPTHLTPNRAM